MQHLTIVQIPQLDDHTNTLLLRFSKRKNNLAGIGIQTLVIDFKFASSQSHLPDGPGRFNQIVSKMVSRL